MKGFAAIVRAPADSVDAADVADLDDAGILLAGLLLWHDLDVDPAARSVLAGG